MFDLSWKVGPSDGPGISPEQMVPAQVPGAVQLDWAREHGWPEHWKADHFKDYDWMEDKFWLYQAELPQLNLAEGERVRFIAGGIDYQWQIRLDGEVVLEHEGMFTPVKLDLTDNLKNGARRLEVLVFPAPKEHRSTRSFVLRSRVCPEAKGDQSFKPNMSYKTDFHPPLVPLGIWKDAYLEIVPSAHIEDLSFTYEMIDDLKVARCDLAVETVGGCGYVEWVLRDAEGKDFQKGRLSLDQARQGVQTEIREPKLWWPHDLGEPYLYTLHVELRDPSDALLDSRCQRIGFRRIRLDYEGADFGTTRGGRNVPSGAVGPPVHFEINGRLTFIRGSNWISPNVFPGAITEANYRSLLEMVRDCNLHMLRCWGGAPVNKDAFYDLCDEMGILIWQEFPMSIRPYWGTPEFLTVVKTEARSIICQLRHHPCMALWCGGNELFLAISWSNMQNPTFRLLDSLCFELDPHTPWIPTSPLWSMGHGSYIFRVLDGRDVLQYFIDAECTAYPEFGSAGAATAETIRQIIPEEELWPPRKGTSWETHKAIDAWGKKYGAWLCIPIIEHYFGKQENLDDLLEKSHWLQSLGLQTAYEEARRQHEKPRGVPKCAMALCWCFNEPWPTAANNSIVSWPDRPKPAYEAVKAANRPVMLSARLPRFDWKPDQILPIEIWFLNDSNDPIDPGVAQLRITSGESTLFDQPVPLLPVAANKHLQGPTMRVSLDNAQPGPLLIHLCSPANPAWDSEYRLLCKLVD